jgi:predicted phage terminase large subunit-like protein
MPVRKNVLTKEQVEKDGFVEGEDFYINHSGLILSLKPNEPRLCKHCGNENAQFYSYLHTKCRTCQRRERKGIVAGSAKAIQLDADKAIDKGVPPEEARRQAVALHQKLLASRILARRRLLQFIRMFHPGYQAGWVHEDICRRLERFLQAVAEKKSPRMLLFCPPRLGKSLIASQYFPAWMLGQHPEFEIIASSYNISLPTGFSRRIRELVRDPEFGAIFPDCKLSEESQAVESWRTTSGGGYTAAGVGTGITGKGCHVLIVDDPVKDQEAADSANIREATWEWYLSTAYTRIAPGGGVLGIQTRWNDDDWSGRIIMAMDTGEGEQFEVVSYPAINELGDEYLLEDDTIVQVPDGTDPPIGATLLRTKGSALHPDRYDIAHLHRIKKNFTAAGNVRMWSALYQQNPVPEEGAFFRRDMFKYISYLPDVTGMHVYQAWDFSITEKETSDWIVGYCLAQDEFDNVYELDMVRFKSDENAFTIADAIIAFHQKWNAWIVGFEDGQIWKSIKAVVLRRAEEKRVALNYEVLTPLTDKLVRAGPLRGRMQMGKMYFQQNAHFRQVVDNELLRFPGGKHDDIVDAAAWATRLVLAHQPPSTKKPKPMKSWKDKLLRAGRGETHMAA